MRALEEAGFEAWVVGGFVRDALLGRDRTDVDIASSAPWERTARVCRQAGMTVHETGTQHGTVTVVAEGEAIEVTTFRLDGPYKDGRHPASVKRAQTISEDLARRDFTMNAIAYRPGFGVLDPYGGRSDMARRVIRAVGDPEQRFAEDGLRILRACRFASELGFSIDPATMQGMVRNKGLLPHVSAERVRHELELLLLGDFAGKALVETVDALAAALPELVAMKGFDQCTPYHIYDVLEHTARVIDNVPAEPLLRWSALFHDMGKPATFYTDDTGRGHFFGHQLLSVSMAKGIMMRLKMSPAFAERVCSLVRMHDDQIAPTPRSVKRAITRLDGDAELFRSLCKLKRGDSLGQSPRYSSRLETAGKLEKVLDEILASGDAFTLKQLAASGRDAIEAGLPQGPLVGEALQAALDAVIDGDLENHPDDVKRFLRKRAQAIASPPAAAGERGSAS